MTRFRWIFWLCALPWALGATTLSVSRKEGIATGQVDVLQGLPGALALSYYLTGAGDLHYAVVLHGHNALTAQDIKDAAIQSAATLSTEAGTFTSKSATRLAWNVLDLAPNTTYDVYFVAEASNSNGVFGTVVSVNGTTTHPHAPRLSLQRSGPVRASSSTAEFVVNCSSPGLLHYIIVPTRASQNLSATDIWTSNQTLSLSIPSTNAVQVNVTDLAPFTTYDVWMVTEVKGSDGVLGRVLHAPEAFTTHAVAPDVVNLGCVPRGGTTSELLVGLRLEFPALAFVNYNVQSALRAVEYALFYLATTEGSLEPSLNTPEAIQNATNTTTRHASQLQLSFPAREVNNVAVVAATDTTVDIHANITALKAGTNYSLAIVVETKGSHGLFGRIGTISGCQTHAPAPIAKSIEVAALPKTTNMALLRVSVESAANVHYVVGEPNAFQKVVDHKNALATYVAANESFQVGSIQNVPSNEWTNVTLTNLNASTMYSVVVFTETVDSFGVFGLPSSKTDFKTNEPAGSVAILEAAPVKGSTTQVSISVKPSDPRNIVSMCWKEAAPTAFTCGNHTSVLSNLTEDTIYEMYVVAETAQGVVGVPSEIVTVSTHALPPTELALNLSRIGGRFDLLAATITTTKPCWLHVALLAAENITKTRDTILQNQTTMHYYNVTHSDNGSTALMFDNLQPNATYTLAVFPESLSVNGTGSQVYGALETINATTYAAAPTVLQSAALPLNATVDKILLVVNLTTPGRLHYMITDRDLHDPNVLRTTNPSFYVRRGHFDVVDQVWTTVNETKGGVNVSVPLALPIFEGNHTIDDTLEPDTMYHVFVTTETFDSFGVFGALPAPLLATTHAPPPTFTTLSILPTPWKATSIDLNLTLSRYGLVQYILMLRNPGSAFAFNASNETINISQLDSSILTAGHIQRASLEELGEGVMLNGSLTVSREDWSKQTQTHKAFTNLISGATYELCIVAETDASYGVFGPVSCHVVTTFVDYTNATSAQDEWFVEPVDGTTDQVVLTWHRRSEAPIRPYFVLVKGSAPPSLGANGFSRTTFSEIIPGQHGIVAAGELPSVATNPTTHQIVIEQLAPHTPYFAFFSGETLGSHGVFTDVKGPISTMTHAPPPVLNSYAARPADGNTTGFQLVLELACDKSAQSCNGALIHAVVTLPKCPPPMPLHLAHSCVLVYKRDNVTLPSNTPLKDYKIFLQDDARLKPNTSYAVHLATETINSHGVLSPWTSIATATHPMPPSFVDIQVRPKHASTTELELAFELSTTGLVHYMIAEDTKHVEVLSPYNVSSKKKNGEDWHKYPHQSISYRRTITVTSPKPQIEVLNYLSADTSYTVWVLAETLVDADLYTQILVFANVSTFAPAPLLLAHQAGPTPASTTELRLDYKLNTLQGLVHCMVAMSTRWTPTLAGPAVFGNRIGFDTKVVGQVTINATSSEGSVDIPVPHPDTSYTIYLVTETFNSHGVFGVVAQLDHIKSSAHAPAIINSTVVAADARTDALSVRLELSSPGIVHYSVVEKNHPLNGKEASSIISNTSSVVFLIDGLRESTWYDVYIQTETIGSRGVLGALVKVPSLTPTHGPPPVVLEEVDCTGAPNCELLGREPCWLVSATCGECREGYVGDDGPANTQCTVGAKKKGKKTIGIKISGVKQATPVETEVQPSGAAYEPCPDHSSFSLTLNRCECAEGYAMQHNSCVLLCPPNSSPSSPGKCQCDPGFVLDSLQTACVLRGPGSGPIGGVNAISYSTARLLYKIDTFISTKKGQTVMLVSFGLFLMTVSGLFFSLLPHGTHIEVEAETDLGIEEGSGSGSTSDTLRSLVAFSQVETTPTPADSTSSSSGSSTEGETHSSEHASIIASIWECWLFISDPGAQGEQVEWNKRIFAFFVSVIGMMYFFVIIGFVVDSIRDKMEDLKKGRSNVIEKNHSLLLGWSDKSVALIKQLCLANESEGGGIIVILADMEKEHIETELESQIDEHEYHKTKVVVRSGSPLLVSDLKKVSAHTARSITIMATSMDADKSDAACLRIILGLRGLFQLQGHVVAEVRDIDNEPLVHLVGGSIVETLVSHDIIGRLILLSARSPGLSRVYNSVLGFDGDEFYCKAWPEVVGVAFRDLIPRFPAAAPIGVKTAKGKVVIKPALDYIIQPGDEIIVLAEDNDTYKAEEPVVIPPVAIPAVAPKDKVKEKILVCGWRRDVQDMLVLLDNFLEPGSEVHLVNDLTMDEREEFLTQGGVDMERFENCSFLHFVGNTSVRRYLEPLPLETYTSIMVLCDFQRELDVLNSDSHSLATVLLVRSLQKQRKYKLKESLFGPRICTAIDRWTRHASNKCPCITEILDPRTQKTVVANSTISGHSDFVMSNELISCMLAMISESREVKQILSKLLSPHSNTFMVQPSSRYLTSPTEILSYFQMSMRVLHANELLVGYISKRDKNAPAVLNPKDKTKPIRWRNLDLIVIAGGSALGDRTTDIKRAVVEQIEDSVRRNRGSILARQMSVDDKTVGVVASNPIEAFATTRKSVTYRVLVKPGPGGHKMPKFDADIQLTPEVRHKLMRLNDEVQRFLAKYSSALTES